MDAKFSQKNETRKYYPYPVSPAAGPIDRPARDPTAPGLHADRNTDTLFSQKVSFK